MVTKARKENAITKGVVKEFMKKKNNRMTSHNNLTLIKTKSVICHTANSRQNILHVL